MNSRLSFTLFLGALLSFTAADADHHHHKENKDSGLTECTIQQSNGGGGCVTGFKRVCEKLKNGQKCCGCVPDKNAKASQPDSGLTECSIQKSSGGGGCVKGFKHVCEKLKNGKKCCGCVPDKQAQAPTGEKIEDNPCFGLCSNQCGGATKEARDACVLNCVQTTNCSRH